MAGYTPKFEDTVEAPKQAASGPKFEDTHEIAPQSTPSVGESVLRGAADWGSAGLADEIAGMLTGSGTGGLKQALSYLTGGDYSQDPDVQQYIKARDESRANYKAAQEANPTAYTVGGVGGGIASALIPGKLLGLGAKALGGAEAAGAAAEGAGALGAAAEATPEATSLLANMGQAAKTGAIGGAKMGAAYGLGSSEAQDTAGLAQDVALGAGLGAATGGVLEPAMVGAGAGLKAGAQKFTDIAKEIPGYNRIFGGLDVGLEGKSALTKAAREKSGQETIKEGQTILEKIIGSHPEYGSDLQQIIEKADSEGKKINVVEILDELKDKIKSGPAADTEVAQGIVKDISDLTEGTKAKVSGQVQMAPEEVLSKKASEDIEDRISKEHKILDKSKATIDALNNQLSLQKSRLGKVTASGDESLLRSIQQITDKLQAQQQKHMADSAALDELITNKQQYIDQLTQKGADTASGVAQMKAMMRKNALESKMNLTGEASQYDVGIVPDEERGILNVVKQPKQPGPQVQPEMSVSAALEQKQKLEKHLDSAKALGNKKLEDNIQQSIGQIDTALGPEYQRLQQTYGNTEQAVQSLGITPDVMDKLKSSPEAAKKLINIMESSLGTDVASVADQGKIQSFMNAAKQIEGINPEEIDALMSGFKKTVEDNKTIQDIGSHMPLLHGLARIPAYLGNALGLAARSTYQGTQEVLPTGMSTQIARIPARNIIQNIIKTNDQSLIPVAKKLAEGEKDGDELKKAQAEFILKQTQQGRKALEENIGGK